MTLFRARIASIYLLEKEGELSLNEQNILYLEPCENNRLKLGEDENLLLSSIRILSEVSLCLVKKLLGAIEVVIDVEEFKRIQQKKKVLKAMQVCMKWVILNSTNDYVYPYPKELSIWTTSGYEVDESEFEYDATQLYPFNAAQPRTTEGDQYEPSDVLLPELRPYQKAAIHWMLQREQHDGEELVIVANAEEDCSVYFIQIDGWLYYDPYMVHFYTERPQTYVVNQGVRGGFLADEMGLGKTVEMLGCILSNPMLNAIPPIPTIEKRAEFQCFCRAQVQDPLAVIACRICNNSVHTECIPKTFQRQPQEFVCLSCWNNSNPVPCKTTLIISPASIHRQWMHEVIKHTKFGELSVLIYKGVGALTKEPDAVEMWPSELAKYDVVITTYETLSKDVHYTEQIQRKFRQSRKYPPPPSPLTLLKWWRVCLDEAQMIESPSTKVSLMASRLLSVHKWCITGTPFARSLDDLWGLFSFLQIQPFCTAFWWKHLLRDPYIAKHPQRLHDVLKIVMWRNSKADIEDQLDIPEQNDIEYPLDFSVIEKHFYETQERKCERLLSQASSGEYSMTDLSRTFIRLRQACDHPQVGQHGVATVSKTVLSMDKILSKMIRSAKLECVDHQRTLIATQNLIAGLYRLKENPREAIRMYLESIADINANWDRFEANSVQVYPLLFSAQCFDRLIFKRDSF